MKNNKIVFTPALDNAELFENPPVSAVKAIPEWFKKTPQKYTRKNIDKSTPDILKQGGTFKLCVPFTDAITTGYMITTPCDLFVDNFEGDIRIYWKPTLPVVDKIDDETHFNFPIPVGYAPTVFRFISNWQIKTPKGYSVIIQHPIYRNDLPFHSLTAVIDTDEHPNQILYPFVLKEGWEGTIPAGTPIAQILPFKRHDWDSEIAPYSNKSDWWQHIVSRYWERSYKRQFWTRKRYR